MRYARDPAKHHARSVQCATEFGERDVLRTGPAPGGGYGDTSVLLERRHAEEAEAAGRGGVPSATELMTPGAVTSLAGVDDSRARTWRRVGAPWGQLAGIHVGGSTWVYSRETIEAFLRERDRYLAGQLVKRGKLPPNVKRPKSKR